MPAIFNSPQALPSAWTDVLNNVEETLRKTEAAAAEREQALGHILSSADPNEKHREKEQRDLLPVPMQGWSAVLQTAAKETAEADAVLNAAKEAIDQWLSKAEALTQRLAQWGESGV